MTLDRLNPILDALVTRVAGLSVTIDGVVLPVLKRKATVRRRTLDPPAMITVAKSRTPERTTRRRFGLWQTAYVIDVVLHAPYSGADDDVPEYALVRDRIVDLLKSPPLPGAAHVFDMDCQAADWLSPVGEQTEYDWFSCQVTATVAHE